MPSNTLAVLYGLALDCKERHTLGDDVDIDIAAIDETNKYDLEHITTTHSTVSVDQRKQACNEAWDIFYQPDHIRTVMRRAAATGINAGNMMFLLCKRPANPSGPGIEIVG